MVEANLSRNGTVLDRAMFRGRTYDNPSFRLDGIPPGSSSYPSAGHTLGPVHQYRVGLDRIAIGVPIGVVRRSRAGASIPLHDTIGVASVRGM